MKSVRMLATGAVVLFSLSCLTAPVRACDDRYIDKCEAEAAAAFAAEQPNALPAARRKVTRVRSVVAVEKPVAPAVVKRTRAPRFAAPASPQPNEPFRLASEDEQAAVPESPLARRFRGFIDPQPMTNNSFEALRRPRLDTAHLAPAPTIPPSEEVAVAADDEIVVVADVSSATAKPGPVVAPAPAPAFAETTPANVPTIRLRRPRAARSAVGGGTWDSVILLRKEREKEKIS